MQVKRKVAAGGVVIRQNNEGFQEVLLVQQSEHKGWGFPKGHLDPGETPEHAALREVEEETGVCGRILQKLVPTHYSFVNKKGRMIDKTVYWYLMSYEKTGTQTHAHEVDAVEWIAAKDVRERLTFKEDQMLFKSALQAAEQM